MDDRELDSCIRNYKKTGDNVYFEKIYKSFFQKIYRFVLLNTSDKQTAEDITVDVFYKVYKHLKKVNLNSVSFKPWIYKIARNLIIDYYRKKSKHIQSHSLEKYLETEHPESLTDSEKIDISFIESNTSKKNTYESLESDFLVESEFSNQELLKGLESLPDIQKQVLILRFVEGLDYKHIGMILNKSETSVRAIKFRAILRLKELLLHE